MRAGGGRREGDRSYVLVLGALRARFNSRVSGKRSADLRFFRINNNAMSVEEGERSRPVYAAAGPASPGSITNVLRQLVRCVKPRDPAFHENVLAGREDFRSVERSRIHTDLLGRFCAGEHQVAAARCAKTPCSMHGGGILGSISSDPGEAGRGKGSPCDYRRTGITLTHPAMAITGVQGRRCHAKSDFSAQTTPVMDRHDDLRL
jgi:hypothetical protein